MGTHHCRKSQTTLHLPQSVENARVGAAPPGDRVIDRRESEVDSCPQHVNSELVLRPLTIGAILLALGCCRRATENPPEKEDPVTAVRDRRPALVTPTQLAALVAEPPPTQWFGVTLSGRKIGHASLELRREGDAVVVASSLTVSRAGQDLSLQLTEERRYAAVPPHELEAVLSRETSASDGISEIRVARRGDAMERRRFSDGKLTRSEGIPRSRETLADSVSQSFVRPAWLERGDQTTIVELDLDGGLDRQTNAEVLEKNSSLLAGVEAATAVIELRRGGEAATQTTEL